MVVVVNEAPQFFVVARRFPGSNVRVWTRPIKAFGNILDATTIRIHAALEAFEKDPVTADLFTSILAAIEKYAWMLRAQDTD